MEQSLYELPEGWSWNDLGDKCALENGDRGKNYPSRAAFINKGIPVINAGNLTDSGIDASSLNYISRERFGLLGGGKVKEGDILFCLRGSLGKSAIVRGISEGAIASSLVIVRPVAGLDRDFLQAYFNSHLCASMIEKYDNGAAQPNLSSKSLKKFQLPLPPLDEQKRIVAKLDALFTRIDAAITHLQETLELSKALFASTLDGAFSELEDRVQIGEITHVKGGKRLPKGEKLQEDPTAHPYIRVADFRDDGTIELAGLKYISDGIHEKIKRYTINSKDLYISIAGTIGKTGVVPVELNGANLTENAAKLVFKEPENIDVRFAYYFTLSHDFAEQAGLATKVVAQPKLALTRLSKIEIPIAELAIQQRIVEHLNVLAEHTHTLEAETQERLDQLTSLKSSLLDSAFRGQL